MNVLTLKLPTAGSQDPPGKIRSWFRTINLYYNLFCDLSAIFSLHILMKNGRAHCTRRTLCLVTQKSIFFRFQKFLVDIDERKGQKPPDALRVLPWCKSMDIDFVQGRRVCSHSEFTQDHIVTDAKRDAPSAHLSCTNGSVQINLDLQESGFRAAQSAGDRKRE